MKKQTLFLLFSAITLACSIQAQPGARSGPRFSGTMAKLFGDNTSFSANVECEVTASAQQTMTMPGKLAFDSGKSRFEMNLGEAKGGQMPPGAGERMKAMGMDTTVMIAVPDKKLNYLIYPGLTAYVEMPLQDPDATKPDASFKKDTTELGKETVDGHPCVKNKVVITDDEGKKHESTVWNATDLKNFPIKIETSEQGNSMTMVFSDVKTAKPDAALFNPPSDYKKYESFPALMQQEMMKHMGAMTPPRQ